MLTARLKLWFLLRFFKAEMEAHYERGHQNGYGRCLDDHSWMRWERHRANRIDLPNSPACH